MTISGVEFGGVVLCGGKSRRMQTDKAWLRLGGEYWLQRVVRLVGEVVGPVAVACREDQPLPSLPEGVHVVTDTVKHIGPLAGLASGLNALAEDCQAAFVVSCDHPLLEPAFVRLLCEQLAGYEAVVPIHEGRAYPLTAAYRTKTRTIIADHITRGDYKVMHWVEQLHTRWIDSSRVRLVDPPLRSLININDAAQLDQLQARFAADRE